VKKKYAVLVLADKITVREFEHRDDFDMARQALVAAEKRFVALKFNSGVGCWVMPEMVE